MRYERQSLSGRTLVEEEVTPNSTNNGSQPVSYTADDITFHVISTKDSLTSWWKRLSVMEKILLLLCCFLGVFLIIFIILYCIASSTKHPDQTELCLTPHCVESAGQILQKLDTSVDPCENFFDYSCGTWVKNTFIPPSKSHWDAFTILNYKMYNLLRTFIESWSEIDDVARAGVYSYYTSCMDKPVDGKTNKEKYGKGALLNLVKDLGNTSFLGAPNASWPDFRDSLKVLIVNYSLSSFLGFTVMTSGLNSSANIIGGFPPELNLENQEYYLNITGDSEQNAQYRKVHNMYKKLAVNTFIKLGSPLSQSEIEDKVDDLITLETFMAENLISLELLWSLPSNRRLDFMTIGELQDKYDFLDWEDLLYSSMDLVNIALNRNETIQLHFPEYFNSTNEQLKKFNPDTLRNYVVWSALYETMKWSSSEFSDFYYELHDLRQASEYRSLPPWEFCIRETDSITKLSFVLGSEYSKKYVQGDRKIAIHNMTKAVKEAFKEHLKTISWLDPKTRQLAVEKVVKMTDRVAFPEYLLNETYIKGLLADVTLNSTRYFQNNINLIKAASLDLYRTLRSPANKEMWEMTPQAINAYYNPASNYFIFPAGIFQIPFYDVHRTISMNFGGIGVVIGHELAHGFDNSGKNFDADGNQRQWMSNESISKFDNLAKCFVDQYKQYKVYDRQVDGQRTLGENIADNGGIKTAYKAYKQWVKDNGELPLYPGIDLNHDQLFFLSFGQIWCIKETKERALHSAMVDSHSPAKTRVRGALSNTEEFAKAFNCKPGSKMNPIKKCSIW